MATYWLGGHTFGAGGMHMAIRRAAAAGMNTAQIFTSAPRFFGDKAVVAEEKAKLFQEATSETGIRADRVLVHAAYVLNTASPEEEKRVRAHAGLVQEMRRSSGLGVYGACFHPGSATDGDRDSAAERVGEAIVRAIQEGGGDAKTRILIENTAGAGNTFGRTPKEIASSLAAVPMHLRHRTGYGLDTCHLFAAGFDIASSRESLHAVLDEFAEATGERPAFFHLNDSQGKLGTNKDRHALLGEGAIGLDAFEWLLQHPFAEDVPLLLETPPEGKSPKDRDASPDPGEVRMMALLKERLPVGAVIG